MQVKAINWAKVTVPDDSVGKAEETWGSHTLLVRTQMGSLWRIIRPYLVKLKMQPYPVL